MFAWLYNQFVAPLLLIAVVILVVLLGIQTVRINGISFFGWYAIDGYKPLYEKAHAQTVDAIDKCNAATAQLVADGQKELAAANAKADQALRDLNAWKQAYNQKNAQLEGILANAQPGDTRLLGPVVMQYLNQLRGAAPGSNGATASQPGR